MEEPNRQQRVGREGEDQAARYLQQLGCTVVARNFRTRRGEIDLIVRDQGVLVFVEIKTCSSDAFGRPESWVTPRKQRRVAGAALTWIHQNHCEDQDCRFDVIAIDLRRAEGGLQHIRNAFWMPDMDGRF
ncbi:MAG TPA: YraN family protein [bacterium]|nr:YraN family protein [bacterium]HOZ20909.1 YraN family protein [bacterium]